MPQKKTANPNARPDEQPLESIAGINPSLNQIHRMSRYKNGMVYIERDPLVSHDPAGGPPKTTPFAPILEKFHDHRFLWDTIKNHPLPHD